MTFQEWLDQVRALKSLYEDSGHDPAADELADSLEPLTHTKREAWAALETECQTLLENLQENCDAWKTELDEPALLSSEFLDENIPVPMRADLVDAILAARWGTPPSSERVTSLSDWLQAVQELKRADRLKRPTLGHWTIRLRLEDRDDWTELLAARRNEWREELVGLGPRVDRDLLKGLLDHHALALLTAIATATPQGHLPLPIVELGLELAVGRRTPPEAARPFLAHLPLDAFDWENASIDSAWWEFLDWCEFPRDDWFLCNDFGKLSLLGEALGPAKWTVYYNAANHAGALGHLFFDVYHHELPDWLADLAAHLLESGRPEEAWELAQLSDDCYEVLGCGGVWPEMQSVQEKAEREMRRRRISGIDMAQAYVEEYLGEAFQRVSKKTRECLISAAIAVHRPGNLPGSAASELWLALEAEWKYQIKLFRKLKAADYHEDLGVLDWVKEITEGPHTRLVWDFLNSRQGKALKDKRIRKLLRSLRDLRNAHEHTTESVEQDELRGVMRAFWEDGLLRDYLQCLLPSPRG